MVFKGIITVYWYFQGKGSDCVVLNDALRFRLLPGIRNKQKEILN